MFVISNCYVNSLFVNLWSNAFPNVILCYLSVYNCLIRLFRPVHLPPFHPIALQVSHIFQRLMSYLPQHIACDFYLVFLSSFNHDQVRLPMTLEIVHLFHPCNRRYWCACCCRYTGIVMLFIAVLRLLRLWTHGCWRSQLYCRVGIVREPSITGPIETKFRTRYPTILFCIFVTHI